MSDDCYTSIERHLSPEVLQSMDSTQREAVERALRVVGRQVDLLFVTSQSVKPRAEVVKGLLRMADKARYTFSALAPELPAEVQHCACCGRDVDQERQLAP